MAVTEITEASEFEAEPTEPPKFPWYEIMEWGSSKLRLCGYGKYNNWTVRLTNWMFVDCGCCWVMRGITFGIVVASAFWISFFTTLNWLGVI